MSLQISQTVNIPKQVKVWVKARIIRVTGKRGTLTKNFKHSDVQITVSGKNKRKITVTMFFGSKKRSAVVRTIASHITNMIKGVTKGFQYKMRFVYAHFPVNCNIPADGSSIEIHNFLGEKVVRRVKMLEGVSVDRSEDVKDEIKLTGNDVELVARSCALIHESTLVKNKDIRKFLDGIYVSEKGVLKQ
eukprot:TRINITY_DN14209_c0_g1_i1.p1 TRINITY_DN14209_c0_g1~~TRINITY_DN14209_c0_g1_i1.p1  ORF type:complete len:189 (-),score=31.09 TRINITY_DN14209_c0_g1_i1:35-601(-)